MSVPAVIAAWLEAQAGLQVERRAETEWFVVLRGERKRTIPVHVEAGEQTLVVRSLFLRTPDENREEVYAFLLRRNLRTYMFRFALAPDGDVLLLAIVPNAAVTSQELDRLFGQLLLAADDAFDDALRLGFASYIAHEQAWREQVGLPRNPIS